MNLEHATKPKLSSAIQRNPSKFGFSEAIGGFYSLCILIILLIVSHVRFYSGLDKLNGISAKAMLTNPKKWKRVILHPIKLRSSLINSR